jgi:hypothetical protein
MTYPTSASGKDRVYFIYLLLNKKSAKILIVSSVIFTTISDVRFNDTA